MSDKKYSMDIYKTSTWGGADKKVDTVIGSTASECIDKATKKHSKADRWTYPMEKKD